MNEVHVSFQSDVELRGSLVFPEQKVSTDTFPAVLLLHGSGPVDRDENAKMGKINAFKLLSDAIVPHGFAVLRYDKRGVGESKGNYHEAGLSDLVADADAALTFLKAHPNIDKERVFLLGHSEGCTLAVLLQKQQAVKGLILLAGAAESLKTTVMRQGEFFARDFKEMTGLKGALFRFLKVPNKIAKQQRNLIERIEQSTEPVIRVKGQKVNAKWMKEHFAYNVRDDLKHITCPILAITGSKDVQVLPEHAKVFADGVSGEAEHLIIENMNHLLRHQEEDANILSLKQVYKRSFRKPLEPKIIKAILDWLKKYT
ncbi:alpha/beta hydrolase [Pueribacillus sp. YX66]|uniref:alpha/beta hydrolase n=1 Tax=Pueribacillus sp. YX66 TaxID=3229242 RepID=UPI00358D8C46